MTASLRKRSVVLVVLVALSRPAAAQDHTGDEAEPLFNFIRVEADYADKNGALFNWDLEGWVGGDTDRLWLRSEGEHRDGDFERAEAQVYYGHNFATFWDGLIGIRQDFSPVARTWAAASVVGLAPYFFETEASLYLSTKGETALRFKQTFDVLLTQRLIAQPHVEVNVFGSDVPDLDVGAGFSDVEAGLQLRYEIRRQFAPDVDVVWSRKLGETLSRVRAAGELAEETTLRFGIRSWF